MKKVVLFGPESTGKTYLANFLANHYQTLWVPEFARSYLDFKKEYYDPFGRSGDQLCQPQDIPPIVFGQLSMEASIEAQCKDVLICDTNPLQTKVYQEYYFQTEALWLNKIVQSRHYDLYLLTNIDIPWIADGQRDRPNDRDSLFKLFEKILIDKNLNFRIISGDFERRKKTSVEEINRLLSISG